MISFEEASRRGRGRRLNVKLTTKIGEYAHQGTEMRTITVTIGRVECSRDGMFRYFEPQANARNDRPVAQGAPFSSGARGLATIDARNHGKHSPFRHNYHGTRSQDSTAVRNNHTRRRTRRLELGNHMQAVDSHRKLAVGTHTLGHYYTHTPGRRRQHQQPLHPRLQQLPLPLYLPR
jgi:hypothetical protein